MITNYTKYLGRGGLHYSPAVRSIFTYCSNRSLLTRGVDMLFFFYVYLFGKISYKIYTNGNDNMISHVLRWAAKKSREWLILCSVVNNATLLYAKCYISGPRKSAERTSFTPGICLS